MHRRKIVGELSQRRRRQGVELLRIEAESAVAADGVPQRVEDVGDGEDLLLPDAQQVVVERGAFDDRLGGVLQAGGLVDDDGRVAGAAADGALARAHGRLDHAGAAGDDDVAVGGYFDGGNYLAGERAEVYQAAAAVAEARERGYTETLFGRRRQNPELASSNYRIRQAGERQAMNAGIQGLAADIFKVALVRLDRGLEDQGRTSRLDSITFPVRR